MLTSIIHFIVSRFLNAVNSVIFTYAYLLIRILDIYTNAICTVLTYKGVGIIEQNIEGVFERKKPEFKLEKSIKETITKTEDLYSETARRVTVDTLNDMSNVNMIQSMDRGLTADTITITPMTTPIASLGILAAMNRGLSDTRITGTETRKTSPHSTRNNTVTIDTGDFDLPVIMEREESTAL